MLSIVTFFILVVAVTAMQLGRLLQARMIHTSLRQAMATDRELAVDLATKLHFACTGPEQRNDDRNGLVLIAIGVAAAGFALIQADAALRTVLGAALFPLLIGAALLLRDWMVKRTAAKKHAGVE
jgi:low temperature requirement protein LtrA